MHCYLGALYSFVYWGWALLMQLEGQGKREKIISCGPLKGSFLSI